MQNFIIYPCKGCSFQYNCGGITCSFELAKTLKEFNKNVKILDCGGNKNCIYNDTFYDDDFEYDKETTVVIYGEGVQYNPMKAHHVVRWILAPIGVVCSSDVYYTWGQTDLVYYFNKDSRFDKEKDKIGTTYKMLNSLHFNPNFKNIKLPNRHGTCHTMRKCRIHTEIQYIHPDNSFHINDCFSQDDLMMTFNSFEMFISYDPLTFLTVMAAACGCISVVYKVEGKTKKEWLNSLALNDYLNDRDVDLYGVAYGLEDVEFAKNTLHLANDQISDIIQYNKMNTIVPFLNDMDDFDNQTNTVFENFF